MAARGSFMALWAWAWRPRRGSAAASPLSQADEAEADEEEEAAAEAALADAEVARAEARAACRGQGSAWRGRGRPSSDDRVFEVLRVLVGRRAVVPVPVAVSVVEGRRLVAVKARRRRPAEKRSRRLA